jgi:hypothetical protein
VSSHVPSRFDFLKKSGSGDDISESGAESAINEQLLLMELLELLDNTASCSRLVSTDDVQKRG